MEDGKYQGEFVKFAYLSTSFLRNENSVLFVIIKHEFTVFYSLAKPKNFVENYYEIVIR